MEFFEFEFEFEFGMKMKNYRAPHSRDPRSQIPDLNPNSSFRQQTAETEMGSIEKTAEGSKGAL